MINAAEENADAILKDLTKSRGPDVVIDVGCKYMMAPP
jgi:hypothetical protein